MNHSKAYDLIEKFLYTLDQFKVTSNDPNCTNYMCGFALANYWDNQRVNNGGNTL